MMRKYNGAISLFMVVILLTSFIFGGVFIDASRIVVARSKVRNAANSALRSSMSYYDKKLVGDYGLYGETNEDAQKQFEKYFKLNMKIKDENIKMFDYKITETTVTSDTPISNAKEFERQVMEYSKYRAPVTTTLLLIEKVKDVFINFKNASDKISNSTDALDDFKKQFKEDGNQIKQGLKSAKNNAVKQIKKSVDTYKNKLKDDKNYITELKNDIANQFKTIDDEFDSADTTLDKMVTDTENYRKTAQEGIDSINAEAKTSQSQIESTDGVGDFPTENGETDVAKQADNQVKGEQGTLRTKVNELKGKINNIKKEVNTLLSNLEATSGLCVAAKVKLEALKQTESAKRTEYNNKKNAFNNAWQAYSSSQNAEQAYNTAEEALRNSETAMNDLINATDISASAIINEYMNPETSSQYDSKKTEESKKKIRDNLKKGHSELENVFVSIDDYLTKVEQRNSALNAKNNSASLQTAYETAKREKEAAETEYNNAKAAREAQETVVKQYEKDIDSLSKQIKDKMSEIQDAVTPNVEDLNLVDMAKEKIKEELNKIDIVSALKDIFEQLTAEMDEYSENAGNKTEKEDNVDSALKNGILKKIKALCNYAKDFFGTFTNAEKLRNNAYMVDYVMDKCTYLTSQTNRNHHFKKGEVEYIIFGQKSQVANITACIGSITMMRFVINFIDYFITGPGDLIAKAVYALGRGAAKTCLDLRAMFIGNVDEGVGLCPSFDKLKLTYSDHLRLMLFFKLSQQQEKMKDTIYTNMNKTLKGGDINKLNTRMTAKVEVEVNMLVLPIFFGEFTGKHFRNGNYVIQDEITMRY